MSQTAEYALRAMAWLASTSPDAPVRAKDLSAGSGIPTHYLSKILRRLVLADVLASRKGHGGGFTLSRPPEEIRFMEVLAAVDALPSPNRCSFGWGTCDKDHPCPLHEPWDSLNTAFRDWAFNTTLADVQQVPFTGPPRPSSPTG